MSCVVVLGSVLCGGVGAGSVSVVVLSSVLCGGVVVSLVLVVSVWWYVGVAGFLTRIFSSS